MFDKVLNTTLNITVLKPGVNSPRNCNVSKLKLEFQNQLSVT